MRARYFGRRNFGQIAGFSRALVMPIGFLGPIAAGWIYDVTGSYITAFTLLAILLGAAALIISFTTPPKANQAE
jgi:hypothetical protein